MFYYKQECRDILKDADTCKDETESYLSHIDRMYRAVRIAEKKSIRPTTLPGQIAMFEAQAAAMRDMLKDEYFMVTDSIEKALESESETDIRQFMEESIEHLDIVKEHLFCVESVYKDVCVLMERNTYG